MYLRRSKDVFLIYREKWARVHRYTNASFQFDKDDSKSQSGYVFTLNNRVVNSKHEINIDSTTEAEHIATSEVAKEVVWIRKFINELRVVPSTTCWWLLQRRTWTSPAQNPYLPYPSLCTSRRHPPSDDFFKDKHEHLRLR